jgi:hypothetical protein
MLARILRHFLVVGYILWVSLLGVSVVVVPPMYTLAAKGTSDYQIVEKWEAGYAEDLSADELARVEEFIRPIRNERIVRLVLLALAPLALILSVSVVISRYTSFKPHP